MCTSIKIDEAVLRDVLPELNSTAAIGRWAQLLIDQHINALTKESRSAMPLIRAKRVLRMV